MKHFRPEVAILVAVGRVMGATLLIAMALCGTAAWLLVRIQFIHLAIVVVALPTAAYLSVVLHELGHLWTAGKARQDVLVEARHYRVVLCYPPLHPAREAVMAVCGPLLPMLLGAALLVTRQLSLVPISVILLTHMVGLCPPSADSANLQRALAAVRFRFPPSE